MPIVRQLDGAIKILFPDAVLDIDYVLQQDSAEDGPFISKWNLPDPKPTQSELEVAEAQHIAKMASEAYKGKRKAEYPDIGEQLDAQWKAFEKLGLTSNINAGEGTPEKMFAKIKAVKTKYPKSA